MAHEQGRHRYRREVVAALDALFPPNRFRRLSQHGNEDWSARKVVWVSLIMFWLSGKTLEERFSAARRIVKFVKPHWKMPVSYSGFVAAQLRWWPLIERILMVSLRPEVSRGSSWRVRGWLMLAVDGSRFACPRTVSNEQGLECAGREKTAPQIFQTLLQHVGTGLPWEFRLGPGTASERGHFKEMLAELPERTLLTADSGFVSYDLCSLLTEANQRFVMRIGGNKTLIENLDEHESGENIVSLWPTREQSRPPLKLRRIVFRSKSDLPVVLITNVLDSEILSDEDAQELYRSRWGIEVYFRHLKQTMDFQRVQSRTPATALNEHAWRVLSFWTLQRITVTHQIAAGQNPRRFSAATARREIREVLQLMQQSRSGTSLAKRCLASQTDTYKRTGNKTSRDWARKKNDKPPKPPKTRPANKQEIQKAKQLGFQVLLL